MLANGAMIIDVRTHGEFQGGHVNGAKNVPLNTIPSKVGFFKKQKKPLILCCASGSRSGQATNYLKSQGIECINGGGWLGLNGIVSR